MPIATLPSMIPFSGIISICAAYCAVMMLAMCLLMYSKQRKKAYLLMAAAFFFIMTYEGLNIHQSFAGQALLPDRFMRPLQLFSLALLNLSVLLLYRKSRRAYYTLTAVCAVLLSIPMLLLPAGLDPFWAKLYLHVVEALILLFSFAKIAPLIGQRIIYTLGLIMYSVWAVIQLGYAVLPPGMEVPKLVIYAAALPLLFYSVVFFILFQRIMELMQSIYRSSITDGLTGLYNRRHFMKHLNRCVLEGLRISAIFCDIDNFKKLNDTYGHAKADEVLKQVAAIMEEELDSVGMTGRYGGEELVALVINRGIPVSRIAESIRARVAAETIVTVSVGYSTLRKGLTGETLLQQADTAMYHAKTTGKNKVTGYRNLTGRARASGEIGN